MPKKSKQKKEVSKPQEEIIIESKETKKISKKHYSYIIVGAIIIVILIGILIVQLTAPKVKTGDIVKVDYTGTTEDGKIFDTSVEEIGFKENLKKPKYEPFEFKIGSGQVIPGFEEALIGMSVGEKKTITLQPDKAYGPFDQNRVLQLNKELQIKYITDMSFDSYKNFFNEEPMIGKEFSTKELPWKLKVIKIENQTVSVQNQVVEGQKVVLPGTSWESIIVSVGEVIKLVQNPKIGDFVSFPTQQGFVSGEVVEVNNEIYKVDTNHPLAGRVLKFDITLREIRS